MAKRNTKKKNTPLKKTSAPLLKPPTVITNIKAEPDPLEIMCIENIIDIPVVNIPVISAMSHDKLPTMKIIKSNNQFVSKFQISDDNVSSTPPRNNSENNWILTQQQSQSKKGIKSCRGEKIIKFSASHKCLLCKETIYGQLKINAHKKAHKAQLEFASRITKPPSRNDDDGVFVSVASKTNDNYNKTALPSEKDTNATQKPIARSFVHECVICHKIVHGGAEMIAHSKIHGSPSGMLFRFVESKQQEVNEDNDDVVSVISYTSNGNGMDNVLDISSDSSILSKNENKASKTTESNTLKFNGSHNQTQDLFDNILAPSESKTKNKASKKDLTIVSNTLKLNGSNDQTQDLFENILAPLESETNSPNSNSRSLEENKCCICGQTILGRVRWLQHKKEHKTGIAVIEPKSDTDKMEDISLVNYSTYDPEDECEPKKSKLFKCDSCIKEFITKNELAAHTIITHQTSVDPSFEYLTPQQKRKRLTEKLYDQYTSLPQPRTTEKCDYCEEEFTNKYLLRSHQRSHVRFKCKDCGRWFQFERFYKSHLLKHATPPLPSVALPCDQCERVFRSNTHLKAHKKNVHEHTERTHKCEVCGLQFKSVAALKSHGITHEQTLDFKCSLCGKGFGTKHRVLLHEERHARTYRFECSVCHKKFITKSVLIVHMRTHTGERPFACTECPAKFADKGNLRQHFRIHTGEKLYKCDMCDNAYTQKSSLNTHKKTHITFKPFECRHCGKQYSEEEELQNHLRKAHNEDVWIKCKYCDQKFTNFSHFKSHQKMHSDVRTKRSNPRMEESMRQLQMQQEAEKRINSSEES